MDKLELQYDVATFVRLQVSDLAFELRSLN